MALTGLFKFSRRGESVVRICAEGAIPAPQERLAPSPRVTPQGIGDTEWHNAAAHRTRPLPGLTGHHGGGSIGGPYDDHRAVRVLHDLGAHGAEQK